MTTYTFGFFRQYFERIEKNKIDLNNMQDSIDAAVGKLEVPTSEPVIKDESVLTLIPPCNREATLAQGVYNLEDILTVEEMDAMDDLLDTFINQSPATVQVWRQNKTYTFNFDYWINLGAS